MVRGRSRHHPPARSQRPLQPSREHDYYDGHQPVPAGTEPCLSRWLDETTMSADPAWSYPGNTNTERILIPDLAQKDVPLDADVPRICQPE